LDYLGSNCSNVETKANRATDAGLVLGPGALVITLFAPIAAQLIQRQIVSARVLLTIGLVTIAASMWYFSTFTPATDYTHYALARAYQGLGYGFFFVPVNVLAYSQLKPEQNDKASSLTNLLSAFRGGCNKGNSKTASPISEESSIRQFLDQQLVTPLNSSVHESLR